MKQANEKLTRYSIRKGVYGAVSVAVAGIVIASGPSHAYAQGAAEAPVGGENVETPVITAEESPAPEEAVDAPKEDVTEATLADKVLPETPVVEDNNVAVVETEVTPAAEEAVIDPAADENQADPATEEVVADPFVDDRENPGRRENTMDIQGIMMSKFEFYQNGSKDYNANKDAWVNYMNRLYDEVTTADSKDSYDLNLPWGSDLRFASFETRDQYNAYLSNWYDEYFDGRYGFIEGTPEAPGKTVEDAPIVYGRVGQQRNDALLQIKLNNLDFEVMDRADWNRLDLQLNFMRLRSTYYPEAVFSIVDKNGKVFTGFDENGDFKIAKSEEVLDTAYYDDAISDVSNDFRYSVRYYNPIWEFDLSSILEGNMDDPSSYSKISVIDLINFYSEKSDKHLNNRNVADFQDNFNEFVTENWMDKTFSTIADDIVLLLREQRPEMYQAIGTKLQKEGDELDNEIRNLLANSSTVREFIFETGDWAARNRYVPGGTSARIPLKLNFSQTGEYTIEMDLHENQAYPKGQLESDYRSYTVTPRKIWGITVGYDVVENELTQEQKDQFRTQEVKSYSHKYTDGSYNVVFLENPDATTERVQTKDYLKVIATQPRIEFNTTDRLDNDDTLTSTALIFDGTTLKHLADRSTATVEEALASIKDNQLTDLDNQVLHIDILDDNTTQAGTQAVLDTNRIRVSLAAFNGDVFDAANPQFIEGTGVHKLMTLDELKALLPDLAEGRYRIKYWYSAPDSVTQSSEDITLGNESEVSKQYAETHDGLSGIVWSENHLYRDLTVVKLGTFTETHVYVESINGVERIVETVVNEVQSGYSYDTYNTDLRPVDGFAFDHVENLVGDPEVGDDGMPIDGNFTADVNKEVTYVYVKTYTGTFKENHVYRTLVNGEVVEEVVESGETVEGRYTDEYETGKIDRDGYELVAVEATKGEPEFNEQGEPTTGNFRETEDLEVTYVYVKTYTGTFKENHVYRTIVNGEVVEEVVEAGETVEGRYTDEYETGKIDRDGYELVAVEATKGEPAFNEQGEPTTGNFRETEDLEVTYIYVRVINETPSEPEEPTPSEPEEPTPSEPEEPTPSEPEEPTPSEPEEPTPSEPEEPTPSEPEEPTPSEPTLDPETAPDPEPTPDPEPSPTPVVPQPSGLLPNTGESTNGLLFAGGALSILMGLGLIKKRKVEEE